MFKNKIPFKSLVMRYDYCSDCTLSDAECEEFGTLDGDSYCFLFGKYLKPLSFRIKL